MDPSTPDNRFTLSIQSQDTANHITVQTSEDLQTALELLNYHARQALGQTLPEVDPAPTEIEVRPHIETDSTTTEQLKTSINQLQTQVENTITDDEIHSFQDAFSQELEKLRNRVGKLESDTPREPEQVEERDPDNQDEDTDSERTKHDTTTLEQFRENSGNERTNKILEVIKQHAPITRTEIGQQLFNKEVDTEDDEYKEISNYWPHSRVEITGTEGQTNVYQPKNADKHEENTQPEEEEECDCPTDRNGRKTHNESCPKVRALAEDNDEEEQMDSAEVPADDSFKDTLTAGPTDTDDGEEENGRDWPELELTGYTKDEYEALDIAGQTEVVIRNLLNYQPCTLAYLCNQIFTSSTKPPKNAIHQYLENFWDDIIIHSDGKYSVTTGVESDPDEHSIYRLWKVRREGERYACKDCDETYDSSRDARDHRQEQGHLNWGFATGGALVDKWRKNSKERRAETA